MKPRLSTSKKWTPFPKDYVSQIQQAFAEAFPQQVKTSKLIIEGRIFPEEIMLRVGLLEKDRLLQNNFEVSVNYSNENQNAVTGIHSCIDAAASLMNEYLESEGEVDFPRTWKVFDFDGKQIWVQYSTVNTELESEADRILGIANKTLVAEEIENPTDALAVAEVIPSEDLEDENVDLKKPSLFSGKSESSGKKKRKKEDMH